MFLRKTKNFILDLVFPKFCFGCGKEGLWLCLSCQRKIVQVKTQVCPECGKISLGGKFCKKHKKKLTGIVVACYYQEGPIKELIHNFKYNHILELKNILSPLFVSALKENFDIDKNLLIIAVPLHFLRKAQRGYNQAEILARDVAQKLKIEKNFDLLRKIRHTKPQVLTEGKKRQKNLKNCFKIGQKINLKNRTIIIVDDVTTTGTTLEECAIVLKKAGAKKVWGMVVARG